MVRVAIVNDCVNRDEMPGHVTPEEREGNEPHHRQRMEMHYDGKKANRWPARNTIFHHH